MRNIFLTIIVLGSFNVFAQQIPNRLVDPNTPLYVFEFDEKIDKALYKKIQGITMITDFEILINGKKISFHSILIDDNQNLRVNTTRIKLEEIIKNDNTDKQPRFYIYFKKENRYYLTDYLIFRTIRD